MAKWSLRQIRIGKKGYEVCSNFYYGAGPPPAWRAISPTDRMEEFRALDREAAEAYVRKHLDPEATFWRVGRMLAK